MSHETIKGFFSDAVSQVASNISQYTINPGKDLTRTKKWDRRLSSHSWYPAVHPVQKQKYSIFII